MTTNRSDLVAKIAKAATFAEQQSAVAALDAFDKQQTLNVQAARDLDWADTVVRRTLSPVVGHEISRNESDTDWISDYQAPTGQRHAALAAVSAWYDRTSAEVKSDPAEFAEQASGFLRREASKHGAEANAVYAECLQHVGFMWSRDGFGKTAASGLPQLDQAVDPNNQPSVTPYPTEVFDNFAPEVHPINQGVVGTEGSDRAPLMQQIQQDAAGQGQPEAPGGHSETADFSNSYSEVPAGGPDDDDSLLAQAAYQPTMAIGYSMNLDDFRRQAASGLPQIDQVVDPNNQPSTTPYPTEVAWPWLLNGVQPQEAAEADGEEDEDGKSTTATRHEAAVSYENFSDDDLRKLQDQYAAMAQGRAPMPGHLTTSHAWGEHSRIQDELSRRSNLTPAQQAWLDRPTKSRQATKTASSTDEGAPSDSYLYGYHTAHEDHQRQRRLEQSTNSKSRYPVSNPFLWGTETHAGYRQGLADARSGLSPQLPKPTWPDEHPDDGHYNELYGDGDPSHIMASRKTADTWTGQGGAPQIADTTFDNEQQTHQDGSSYQRGAADAQDPQARPTFADNSSAVPAGVQQYSQGYSDNAATTVDNPDVPQSVQNTASVRSAMFTTASIASTSDFRKGYNYARQWKPGTPLVTLGSAEFESGVFAGLTDYSNHREAFRAAHRKWAKKDGLASLANRMANHDAYADYLSDQGIDVTASTTTDLESTGPGTSPSASGQTPINGPGTVPPLSGGFDPAAPGGPAPYNGAEPFGSPVVPGATTAPSAASVTLNDLPGGPVDQNKLLAFRRTVQASLLAKNTSKKG